jgi:hypothetical protein
VRPVAALHELRMAGRRAAQACPECQRQVKALISTGPEVLPAQPPGLKAAAAGDLRSAIHRSLPGRLPG